MLCCAAQAGSLRPTTLSLGIYGDNFADVSLLIDENISLGGCPDCVEV
jgi:hypothetical protein